MDKNSRLTFNRIRTLGEAFGFTRQRQRQGKPADAVLNGYFRENKRHGSKDRRFISTNIFAFFRWSSWLTDTERQDPEAALLLAWLLDENPVAAFERDRNQLLNRPFETRYITGMAGLPLAEKKGRLQAILGCSELPELFPPEAGVSRADPERWLRRPPTWIRCRRRHRAALLERLRRGEYVFRHSERSELSFAFEPREASRLSREGLEVMYEVQDIASQQVALMANPDSDSRWFDACAGAGGKTLHLADLLSSGQGQILANDIRPVTLDRLRKRLSGKGIDNARLGVPAKGETFDGVLIDAPCSNSGTWRRSPWLIDATRRGMNLKGVIKKQDALLSSYASLVKPGGTLVYSTCSQYSAENEERVAAFTKANPDFQSVRSRYFTPPDYDGDVIFVALLQRRR